MSCVSQVLSNRTRLVSYLPGINVLVQRVTGSRSVSAGSSLTDEPKMALSPFHLDPSVRLRGTMEYDWRGTEGEQKSEAKKRITVRSSSPLSKQKQEFLVFQFTDEKASPQNVWTAEQYFDNSRVECAIQSCPELLKKEFHSMFPEAPSSEMTIVTVTQKTQNDMSSWSADVEQEREQMLDKFVLGAKEMCSALQREGFWADFIDPSSGLAFFGAYTNNTLFETDERYSQLGFQIEDLGCCRVIRHSLWGTHVFVGTICTNAPPGTLILQNLQNS